MTMTKQDQIANFLNQHVTTFPRCYGPRRYSLGRDMWNRQRPLAPSIAKEFLGITEFRTLQLGTWLGTTDGEIITQAVEIVVPMFYAEDVALIVEALKLASAMQLQEGRQKAVAGAAATLFVLGIGYAASRGSAA